ncbi:MAG: hypothetical protein L3J59_07365 [Methylococcaceae bacterium]|nr:hypothetical protein [Methylococcaceae bacterium]
MNTTVIGLFIVILISTIAGWIINRSKQVEKPVKVMLFVLYFWVFVFIQLAIFSVLYHFGILDSVIKRLG